ncbi:MAG: hypothetical protein C5S44_00520 [Candidatus Methanocomedens sp.]|nr:MAG: hypothetical protein C5S44_00520 [ANME-2 cluster archaeon]
MFRQPRGTPSHPPTPEATARIAEHPRAVCRSVWLGRARCFSITVGERKGRRVECKIGVVSMKEALTAKIAKMLLH